MNTSLAEIFIIGALNTIIQFLPLFIKNPNSSASARLRHYVEVAVAELQQFLASIPQPTPVAKVADVTIVKDAVPAPIHEVPSV